MTLERRNPLPIGRYAVTLVGKLQMERFADWRNLNKEFVSIRNASLDADTETEFVVFEVDTDFVVRWQGPGFPDRVSDDVETFQDFEQSPHTPDPLNAFLSSSETLSKGWPWILLLAAAVLWTSSNKER